MVDAIERMVGVSGAMRFAYADPPYPGQARKHYGSHPDYAGEVDHRELVQTLTRDFPDGWALSTGSKWLRQLLPLCPENARVMAWVKTIAPPFSIRLQYTWEPVILAGGRPFDGDRTIRDSLVCGPPVFYGTSREHVVGEKPPQFSRWIFRCLGAGDGDEFVDLFPGSGTVGHEWQAFAAQLRLAV